MSEKEGAPAADAEWKGMVGGAIGEQLPLPPKPKDETHHETHPPLGAEEEKKVEEEPPPVAKPKRVVVNEIAAAPAGAGVVSHLHVHHPGEQYVTHRGDVVHHHAHVVVGEPRWDILSQAKSQAKKEEETAVIGAIGVSQAPPTLIRKADIVAPATQPLIRPATVGVFAGLLVLVVFCGLAYLAGRNSAAGGGGGEAAKVVPPVKAADIVAPAAMVVAPAATPAPAAPKSGGWSSKTALRPPVEGPRMGESLDAWESRIRKESGMPSLDDVATKGLAAYDKLP